MPLKSCLPERRQDEGHDGGKKLPQMGEDLAYVTAAAAEDGEKRVPEGALQEAARQPSVGLHVADLGFDAAPSAQRLRQRRGQPAASAADQDLGVLDAELWENLGDGA